jgi:hypothetical protein
MSCSAIAASAFLWLASTAPATPEQMAAAPPPAVAGEPLFVDIVARAGRLKIEVEALRGGAAVPEAFRRQIGELAALDMKAHVTLKERGVDGDLKCILKGISEDLPLKLEALTTAATPQAREAAVIDMAYLLNDNVEVIVAPPKAPV